MTELVQDPDCRLEVAGHREEIEPDARLLAEGWQLRFVSGADRVAEMVALYCAIGYETRVEPAPALCSGCAIAPVCRQEVIYTRKH